MDKKFDSPALKKLQEFENERVKMINNPDNIIWDTSMSVHVTMKDNGSTSWVGDHFKSFLGRAMKAKGKVIVDYARQLEQEEYDRLALAAKEEMLNLLTESQIIANKKKQNE